MIYGHHRMPTLWRPLERNIVTLKSRPAAASLTYAFPYISILRCTTAVYLFLLYFVLVFTPTELGPLALYLVWSHPQWFLVHCHDRFTTTLLTMRAFVSLYHQADSWVYWQKYDEAFVQSGSLALSSGREERSPWLRVGIWRFLDRKSVV